MMRPSDFAELLRALRFAAERHRDQRRKGASASPYINHPIEVAELLARLGGVTDLPTLQAAVLHDTIEDTETSLDELRSEFGTEVSHLVAEVTDDEGLPREERKRLQIERAPHLSVRAKLVRLSDKTCNVADLTEAPPPNWSLERRRQYLEWTVRVVEGCRGTNDALERRYDELVARGRVLMAQLESQSKP